MNSFTSASRFRAGVGWGLIVVGGRQRGSDNKESE